MAKIGFFRTWEVYEIQTGLTTGEVVAGASTFCIYDDGGDKVIIQYSDFGSPYPALQNGDYDPQEDRIVAYFLDSTHIIFDFSLADSDKLNVAVCPEISELHHEDFFPETGEFGAEACS